MKLTNPNNEFKFETTEAFLLQCLVFYILYFSDDFSKNSSQTSSKNLIKLLLSSEESEAHKIAEFFGIKPDDDAFDAFKQIIDGTSQNPDEMVIENENSDIIYPTSYFLEKFGKNLIFSFVDLEESYPNLYKNYLLQKCSLCNEIPLRTSLALCLVCNMLICVHKCAKKDNSNNLK